MRRQFILITVTILAALLMGSCDRHHSKKIQGYIEGRFTYLASSVSGHLIKRYAGRGQTVTVGQKLFVLDPQPQLAELKEAKKTRVAESEKLLDLKKGSRDTILASIKAQIQQAQSDLDLAKITLNRRASLVKSGAISKATYDRAYTDHQVKAKRIKELQSDLAEAELGARVNVISGQVARIDATKARIDKLQWQLSQKTVNAPINGLVFDTFFRKGEFVPAGQAVLAMLSPQNVYLIFFIPEPLLSSIHVGNSVQFTCDGCGAQAARIYFISPIAEYTPPVIFSKGSRHKLVYRIEANIPLNKAMQFHPGQPVDISLSKASNGN